MYYKVIKNNKVIDVLDNLTYLKWQPKHKIMVLSDENEAQAILSSDKNTVWHVEGLYNLPVDGYDEITLKEIDKYEYKQLKALCGKTAEEIIDDFVVLMLDNETKLLTDSLKRLYEDNRIDESKVIKLYDNGYITDKQKEYVLGY